MKWSETHERVHCVGELGKLAYKENFLCSLRTGEDGRILVCAMPADARPANVAPRPHSLLGRGRTTEGDESLGTAGLRIAAPGLISLPPPSSYGDLFGRQPRHRGADPDSNPSHYVYGIDVYFACAARAAMARSDP